MSTYADNTRAADSEIEKHLRRRSSLLATALEQECEDAVCKDTKAILRKRLVPPQDVDIERVIDGVRRGEDLPAWASVVAQRGEDPVW